MVKKYPLLKLKCGTVANDGYGATIMCRDDNNRKSRDFCLGCPDRRQR